MCRAQLRGDVQREPANGGAATPAKWRSTSVAALRFVQQNRNDEAGQTMAEYAVVLAVISLIVVAALTLLGTSAANSITRFASYLTI
jgi:Flp pilus assembly pilin Flp